MTVFVIKNMRLSIKKDRRYRLIIEKIIYFTFIPINSMVSVS